MKKTLLALLLATALTPLAFAGPTQTPTIDQSLNLKSAGGPRISPDGRYVAYQVQKTNWEENAFETEIWIAVTATENAIDSLTLKSRAPIPSGRPIQNDSLSYRIATASGRST